MKGLQMQMEKEGLNFQAMMKLSESLPVEQQAAFISDTAKKAGMKYTEPATKEQQTAMIGNLSAFRKSGDAEKWRSYAATMGLSEADIKKTWETGIPSDITLTKQGLKPLAPGSIAEETEKKKMATLSDYTTKVAEKGILSGTEADFIINNGNVSKIGGLTTNETWDARGSSWGYKAQRWSDDSWEKLNSNVGKMIKIPDQQGKEQLYVLESVWEPGTKKEERDSLPYYTVRNIVTGAVETRNV
jgi:hypothetical protein